MTTLVALCACVNFGVQVHELPITKLETPLFWYYEDIVIYTTKKRKTKLTKSIKNKTITYLHAYIGVNHYTCGLF